MIPSLATEWPVDRLRDVLRPFPAWQPPLIEDDVRAAAITRAEHAMSEPFPAATASAFLDYFRTGGRSEFEGRRIERRRILRDLVVGEAIRLYWVQHEENHWASM